MTRVFPRRRGAVLVATAVCVLVAVSLLLTGVSRSVLRHRQLRELHQARQADLLIAAGQDLALANWRADASYEGQTWDPAVDAQETARVAIEVTPDERSLTVRVTYPVDSERPMRRSATFPVPSSLLEGS